MSSSEPAYYDNRLLKADDEKDEDSRNLDANRESWTSSALTGSGRTLQLPRG